MPKITNVQVPCSLDWDAIIAAASAGGNKAFADSATRQKWCCENNVGIKLVRSKYGGLRKIVDGRACNAAWFSRPRARRSPFYRRSRASVYRSSRALRDRFSGLGLPPGVNPSSLPWCGGIKPLQTMLQDLGLYAGRIDGSVGTGTTNAIVAAQRQFGVPTGAITKGFCGALADAWNAKMAPPAPAPGSPVPGPGGAAVPPGAPDEMFPGGQVVLAEEGGGIMDKWDALPTAGKAGVIGGGVLLLGIAGYAVYSMTR